MSSSWLLTTPLLMLAQARSTSFKKWRAIWILTFLFELLVYFGGCEKPERHPSLWSPVSHPISALEFILVFLGNPFTFGTNLPRCLSEWEWADCSSCGTADLRSLSLEQTH